MARDILTLRAPVDHRISITVNTADMVFTPLVVVNGAKFLFTGREIIHVRNVHATDPFTVTLVSIADNAQKRTKDVVYTLQAGDQAFFGPFSLDGWLQSDGYFYLDGSDASIEFCVIRFPQIL